MPAVSTRHIEPLLPSGTTTSQGSATLNLALGIDSSAQSSTPSPTTIRDEMNRNTMSITGTPSLVTGALTVDTNQALQFDGTTNSGSVPDSTSLSITGSMSLEFFLKIPAIPGSTKSIIDKVNSYTVQINSAGKLQWKIQNSPDIVTVSTTDALQTNTWYHFVCVYNENYAGAQQFGQTSHGATGVTLNDDTKFCGSFSLLETALLDAVYVSVYWFDEVHPEVSTRAVIYTDSGGTPNALAGQSDVVLAPGSAIWRNPTFLTYPMPVLLPAGTYWLGAMASDTYPGNALNVSCAASGGTMKSGADAFSDGAEDPFGAVASTTADLLSVYASYTAVGRTGQEGTASIYVNGALDTSSAYTDGIVDNTNAVDIAPSFACDLDEISIWDRVLSDIEIATHYTAH